MKKIICFCIVVTLLATSCGGGGGGGGSSSRPGTGFRVLHGDIDAPPLDVFHAGETASVGQVKFSESSGYIPSDGVDQSIQLLTSHIASERVASIVVPLVKDSVKTVLFYGDNGAIGSHVKVIDDPVTSVADGTAMVRVIHAAVGAASVRMTAGSVEITSSTSFGDASEYASIASGPVQLIVKRDADSAVIFNAPAELESGKLYSLFVSGDMEYFATGKLLSDN